MHPTKRTGNQSALHPDSEAPIGSLSAQLERLVGNSAGPTSRVLYFDKGKKKFSTEPLAECKEFKNAKLGEETHSIRVEKEVLKSLKKTLKKSLNEFSEDAQKDAINTALGSIRTLRNNRNPISVTQLEASLKPLEALPNKTYKDGLAEQFQILDIDENIQLDNIQQAVSTLAKLIEFLNNTTKFKERHENKTLTIRQGKTKDKALIFYLSDKKLNPAEKEDLRKTQNRETQQKQKANRGSNKALIFFQDIARKITEKYPDSVNLKSTTGPEDGLDTSKWSVEECRRFFEEARRSLVQLQPVEDYFPLPTSSRSPSTVAANHSSAVTQPQITAEKTSTQASVVKTSLVKPKKTRAKYEEILHPRKLISQTKNKRAKKQQGTGSPPSHPVAPAATDEQVRNPFNGPLLNEALVRPRPAIAIQASPETLPQNPLPDPALLAPTMPAAQAVAPNPPENDGNLNPVLARPQPQNRFDQAIGWIKNALDGLRSGISGISSFFRNLFR